MTTASATASRPTVLQCGHCGRAFAWEKLPIGQIGRCACGAKFTIPDRAHAVRRTPIARRFPLFGDKIAEPRARTEAFATAVTAGAGTGAAPAPPSSGKFLGVEEFALLEQAERLALVRGFESLTCLPHLRGVDSHDYQELTALHVLRELSARALLADEVGLGKTIEAGLVMKELVVRGLVKKILVLTPASLTSQWQSELREKFGLEFTVGKLVGDWSAVDRLVGSIDTAKSADHLAEIQKIRWDLVVVDEAHRLKNRATLNWKLVNSVPGRFVLLLSATPFQNNLVELYNLITVLRPGHFATEKEFKERFMKRGDPRGARDPEALKALLREVMVRNRRAEVAVEFPARRAESLRLAMLPDEAKLYAAATSFCRDHFGTLYGKAAGLVAIGYLKQLGSSSLSFRESLVTNVLPRARNSKKGALVTAVTKLVELADAVTSNVKLEALARELGAHDDQVIVFSQYRATQSLIGARLQADGVPFVLFNGAMSAAEKDRAVGEFRAGRRVLLCTEAGAEGRNLQHAWRLVNYDLPWNPMRIEQRIGRVHRMAQTREVIVTNLVCQGTIENALLDLLEKKLNLFQLVVGEVDGIIGPLKFDDRVAALFLESKNDAEFQRRMEDFGAEVETLRSDYELVQRANQDALGGLGAR